MRLYGNQLFWHDSDLIVIYGQQGQNRGYISTFFFFGRHFLLFSIYVKIILTLLKFSFVATSMVNYIHWLIHSRANKWSAGLYFWPQACCMLKIRTFRFREISIKLVRYCFGWVVGSGGQYYISISNLIAMINHRILKATQSGARFD